MFDKRVTLAAEKTADKAISDFLSSAGQKRAIVVTAPAGAGKSWLVSEAVHRARKAGHRVALASPTNEQAHGLVRRLADRFPQEAVTLFHSSSKPPPASVQGPSVRLETRADRLRSTDQVVVGTLDKFGDSISRYWGQGLLDFDVLLIDEAYQADSSRYFAAGHLAPTHFLVGDSGQLNPFSTMENPDRWRGLPEDPLQTAVGILLRNHAGATPLHAMPITRRLDSRAVPIARSFYPTMSFDAAVNPGVRELKLRNLAASTARIRAMDKTLNLASRDGWSFLELKAAPVLTADPDSIDAIVNLVARLLERQPQVRCEREPRSGSLPARRIAVGVSHNDQKDLLRIRFDELRLTDVVVDTANKLQGLEYDVLIAWHPLSGLAEADAFHLDPGRLCVLLTRHRHCCIVIGRAGIRELLEAVPPPTPAFLGHDPDPVLDGWEAHEKVLAGLDPFKVALPG